MSSNDLLCDPHHYRADLNLLSRALKGRWDIAPEQLARVAERAMELVEHQDPRVASKAIDCVVQIEALDQKDRHKLLDLATRPSPAPQFRQTNNTQINLTSDDVYEMLTGAKTFEEIQQRERAISGSENSLPAPR